MKSEMPSASRTILATPRSVFRALIDPEALANWRAPEGWHARLEDFEPGVGGGYRMSFGRSPAGADDEQFDLRVRFVEWAPEERIVEEIERGDAGYTSGPTGRLATIITPVRDGTKVTLKSEQPGPTRPDGVDWLDKDIALKKLSLLLE